MNRKLLTALAIAAFALCYGTVLVTLVQMWTDRPVYSYGFVLPFVAGYVVWIRRHQLGRVSHEPDYVLGVAVTMLGLTLLLVGHVGSIVALKTVSLIVALAGFVLMRWGRTVLSRVWFPLAYLLLGMPVWDVVISRLQEPSQLLSSSIATVLLRAAGIPALHEGVKIVIASVTLEVMRECSGVNQLMTIVAMTLPVAYLMLNGVVRRVLLVAMGVVISYVSNGVRIALVGFLADRGLGDGNLRGAHLMEGLAVSLVGYILLLACFTALSKRQQTDSDAKDGSDSPPFDSVDLTRPPTSSSLTEASTLVVMALLGAFLLVYQPAQIVLRHGLDAFPTRVGEWTVDTIPEVLANRFPEIDDATLRAYPTPSGGRRFARGDDELTRVYRNAAGDRVRLFIGYHRSQHEGKELAGDMSSLLAKVARPVSLPVGTSTIDVNEVTHESATKRRTFLYSYVLNGRIVTDMRLVKMYMVWDAVTHGRNNGAVVMLGWESTSGSAAEASRKKGLELAEAVFPLVTQYLSSLGAGGD
ncbi:MAG: exosortase C-terminal domain/associated protein EpsI [Thermoanaerobaculia bacterium]